MSRRTSVYLDDKFDAAVRASGKSLPDLIRAGLAAGERSRADRLAEAAEQLVRLMRDQGYRIAPPESPAQPEGLELDEV